MKASIVNTAMKNGVIMGILFTVNFFLSVSGMVYLALLSYVITGIIIYFTYRYTKEFRDKENGGFISFGRVFSFIFVLYLFGTLISSFVKYFYLKFFNTAFLEDMYNQNIQIIEQILPNVTEEMYTTIESFLQPQSYTLIAAWSNVLLSVIIGLIIAAIVKRAASPFDKNETAN